MADLSPCALALIAVSEDNRRLRAENERIQTLAANYDANHGARCDAEQERYATIAESACQMLRAASDGLLGDRDPGAVVDEIETFLSFPGYEIPGLRAKVAARDAALDACAERIAYVLGRRDALLVTVRNLSQSTPLPSELEGWEGQRAALVAEVGTLRAAREEAQRERDAAERQVLALTEQLAEAQDDARADREALARYRERDEAAKAGAPDDYFILSLRWTRDNLVTWWCPDNSGYTDQLEQAGRYSRARVESNRAYYDNGTATLAVPCSAVEAAAVRVVKDWALKTLTGKRFRDRLDEPGEGCDVCGQGPPQTRLGIAIVEPKEST